VHALVLYPVAVPVPQGAEQSLFQVTSENEVQPPLTVGENGLVKFTCIVCQFNGLVKFICIVCQFNQNSILPYLSLFNLIRLVYRQRLFLKK
jgi:hypothetical protein